MTSFDLLVCVYTCKAHESLHSEFHESLIGRFLHSVEGATIIHVFADERETCPRITGDYIFVDTKEEYSNLSVKTHKMIKFCVEQYDFDYLMKIDLSSGIKRLNQDERVANRVANQREMVRFLSGVKANLAKGNLVDYVGWRLLKAKRKNIERWARRRNLEIDFGSAFPDGNIPAYYSGKCYILSREFAHYVAKHGAYLAHAHARYLGGSEDLMIGRLYEKYSYTQR